jgi:PAS domain-containing protein
MAVDNLSKRISDLTQYIEDLKTRGISDPGNMAEILSDAVDELQVSLEELSTAEEELCQQNEELIVAHEELCRHKEHLEELVQERTRELEEALAKLQEEINEREAAEEAVKAERQRFIDVLETLPAYLVLLTPDYYVPFANRFFRERFGESHGRHCFEYLFGRTEPCEICETYSVLKTNRPHHWEWTGPDGRNYDIFDFPFTDSDGSTLIMETGIDITERKRAEEALRAAGAYNRSLIEASLDPLVTIGPDGKITDVNEATVSVSCFGRSWSTCSATP